MMAGTSVMQQSRVLGGAQLPQQKASAARPVGRSTAVRTVAMAKRKVNTFDEGWKKVRQDWSEYESGDICCSEESKLLHA